MPDATGGPAAHVETLTAFGLDDTQARGLLQSLAAHPGETPERRWSRLTASVLTPALPFAVHEWTFEQVFAGWDPARGPRPAWSPDPAQAARSNVGILMRERGFDRYQALHTWSIQEREDFWQWAVERLGISFAERPQRILDAAAGPEHPRWLPGARYNIVDS